MTHVERNHLETYLKNINNLIALKKALEQSHTYTQHELWMAIGGFEDYDDEFLVPDSDIINAPSEYYTDHHLDQYTDTVQKVLEEILPCCKLIGKK